MAVTASGLKNHLRNEESTYIKDFELSVQHPERDPSDVYLLDDSVIRDIERMTDRKDYCEQLHRNYVHTWEDTVEFLEEADQNGYRVLVPSDWKEIKEREIHPEIIEYVETMTDEIDIHRANPKVLEEHIPGLPELGFRDQKIATAAIIKDAELISFDGDFTEVSSNYLKLNTPIGAMRSIRNGRY